MDKLDTFIARTRGRRLSFLLVCSALYVAITLLLPSYFSLLEPDSGGYLIFAQQRTAIYPTFLRAMRQLGLSPQQITHGIDGVARGTAAGACAGDLDPARRDRVGSQTAISRRSSARSCRNPSFSQ